MTRYTLDIQVDEPFEKRVDAEPVRRAGLAALAQQDAADGELTIVVTDDPTIRELNRRYRHTDEPTDVLAFPNEARGPFVEAAGFPRYFGDIVISLPRAEAQAEEAGHPLQTELQLLVVHGVLHLLGHDDTEPEERAAMWTAQSEILAVVGVEAHLPE
jgi:probable rRNA maturation factor